MATTYPHSTHARSTHLPSRPARLPLPPVPLPPPGRPPRPSAAESEPVFELRRRRRRGAWARSIGVTSLILAIGAAGFVAGYWSGGEASSASPAHR